MDVVAALAGFSLLSLGSGGAFVWASSRRRMHAALLERCGGALLVAGLALLGAALQCASGVE